MIEQGAELFDRLVVAIGENPEKRYTYPLDQRLSWLREATAHVSNVEVKHYTNLFLATFASSIGGRFVVRGIRNEADYDYERAMRYVNSDLHPGLTTVFLMPPREICEVSSSLVKGMIGTEGWQTIVRKYVPECVFRDLARSHA